MNIEKELKKFLYEWVKKNFGESEADDPSWSIEALSHDLADEFWKLKERYELDGITEDVKYVAANNEIVLSDKEAGAIADDYRFSDAYCSMDEDSIMYFIEKHKGE